MALRKIYVMAACALALSGCADTRYIRGGECRPYGLANQEINKCPQAEYEVRPGNAVAAVVAAPFFPIGTVAAVYLVGWRLFGPVKEKQALPPQQ